MKDQAWIEIHKDELFADWELDAARGGLGSGFQDAKLIIKAKNRPTGKIPAKVVFQSIRCESMTHPLLC
jgi:hypothetical protein